MADKKIHVNRCLTPHIDAFTRVREHIHTQAATRLCCGLPKNCVEQDKADNTYKTRDEKRIIRYSPTANVLHIQLQVVIEQVTACLESRLSPVRRSPGLHRSYSRSHTIHMQCERAWQKMSRIFARGFGKRCCEHLEAGSHSALWRLLYPIPQRSSSCCGK
jgi:hypothetical protein